MVTEHASRAPRSVQRHLGPSELGLACDRQVVAKMAGQGGHNHVRDPWASVMGTAGHAYMEEVLKAQPPGRWMPEHRVTDPDLPANPGTGDAYDGKYAAVVDWKFLGKTTLDKLRRDGPSQKYRVQLRIYGAGFHALGLPVERVVLVAWPRTESTMDKMYVHEEPWSIDNPDLAWVHDVTDTRELIAKAVAAGKLDIMRVPATPDDSECVWCGLYRADANETGRGCPGPKMRN
jgi:hypothetical protein